MEVSEKEPQKQNHQPGVENEMSPAPEYINSNYRAAGKLKGKVALISGGDSGIGRSVAVHYAAEGADVAIIYLEENADADETRSVIESYGRKCVLIKGDVSSKDFCTEAIQKTVSELGSLNILVNNAAKQFPQEELEAISEQQLETTFKTNIFPYFYLSQEALKHLNDGDTIINTTSVTAYRGSEHLIDYASTKGAIVSFTRSLSKNLAQKNIRINAVAPGPIWTPLIVSTFEEEKIKSFGKDTPMGRAGQPSEVGPSYVFLASDDSSYITGQIFHVNGGEIVNG